MPAGLAAHKSMRRNGHVTKYDLRLLVREPLTRQAGPIECVGDHDVVEVRRVLLPECHSVNRPECIANITSHTMSCIPDCA